MAKWTVNYEGWLVVEADTSQKADEIAMKELSSARLACDGVTGEWYTGDVEKEEEQ